MRTSTLNLSSLPQTSFTRDQGVKKARVVQTGRPSRAHSTRVQGESILPPLAKHTFSFY